MRPDSISGDYFTSYDNLEVHRLMLEDASRTRAYRRAVTSHQASFKDKIVMDVGAGTGILSMFCAQAGAKKVYAVEASGLASVISKVAEENKLSNIQVIQGKVEEVCLPNEEKVDIIISEWMGFYLLHEGMLDSVLKARDLHLKPGGMIFPEVAELWCAPCSLPAFYDFWEDVHGVSMKTVGEEWRRIKSNQPQIISVPDKDLLADGSLVQVLDLSTAASSNLDKITKKFVVAASRDGKYQGVCIWFTCCFPAKEDGSDLVVLSTSPSEPATHWKQTVIMLPDEMVVEQGSPLSWELNLQRTEDNTRHYNIQFTMLDPEEERHPIPCQCYMTKCIVIRAFLEQKSDEHESEGECLDSDNSETENCESNEINDASV